MRDLLTYVLGTVSASMTFTQGLGFSVANHSAALLASSSETFAAMAFILAASFLAPLLKSVADEFAASDNSRHDHVR